MSVWWGWGRGQEVASERGFDEETSLQRGSEADLIKNNPTVTLEAHVRSSCQPQTGF